MIGRSFVSFVVMAFLALAVPSTPMQAQSRATLKAEPADAADDAIVGTWLTVATPDGPDAPPPFPQLITYHLGGTAMFSAAGPPIPALGNPGHGAWQKVGERMYAATFIQMTFDETLQLNGSLKLVTLATLNQALDTITTIDRAIIYDLENKEIVSLTGRQIGRKVRPEVVR